MLTGGRSGIPKPGFSDSQTHGLPSPHPASRHTLGTLPGIFLESTARKLMETSSLSGWLGLSERAAADLPGLSLLGCLESGILCPECKLREKRCVVGYSLYPA